jgi:shikimate dehydrogenase
VAHSLSPVIQNAGFRAAGVDGVYVALRAETDELPSLIRGISRGGGGGNVTLPHKERAASVVDVPSPAVRRTGACNTFWGDDGEIHGDNTDVEGFRRALESLLERDAEGLRVLLLGAGGAARAVLVALIDGGAREVRLLNRTTERAVALARRIGGERVRVVETRDALAQESFDIVVNATRLGLDPDDPVPLDLESLGGVGAVMDLVYTGGDTPFVAAARRLGVRTADGREMLIQQGAAAFERWWGRSAPVEAMRGAMEASTTP